MQEIYITLSEVEEMIGALEQRYSISSETFESDPATRPLVSEYDLFEWECLLEQRRELAEMNRGLHRSYVARVVRKDGEPVSPDGRAMLVAA